MGGSTTKNVPFTSGPFTSSRDNHSSHIIWQRMTRLHTNRQRFFSLRLISQVHLLFLSLLFSTFLLIFSPKHWSDGFFVDLDLTMFSPFRFVFWLCSVAYFFYLMSVTVIDLNKTIFSLFFDYPFGFFHLPLQTHSFSLLASQRLGPFKGQIYFPLFFFLHSHLL